MDEQELTRLVEKFSGTVYRAAYCCLRNRADADDITQDVFLALYTSGVEFNGDEHIRAWLIRVAVNRCRNLLRSFRYRTTIPLEEAEQERNSESTQPTASGEQSVFDYLSGGKELDLWYTFDDFKLNIKGVCADDYMAYVLFDIVFDEDFDYSAKAGWTAWSTVTIADAVDKSLDEQHALGMVSQIGEDVISQERNILHCYISPRMFNEYTWGGKTLTLDFMSVGRYIPSKSEKDDLPYQDKQELLFGEDGLHVEIPIDFPIFETTTWEINQPIDLAANEGNRSWYGDELPATVKYFSATPLSWRIYVEADTSDFVKGDAYDIDVDVKAGYKTLEIISGIGSNWIDENGQGETKQFLQPINPADITSIIVCGQTFELK